MAEGRSTPLPPPRAEPPPRPRGKSIRWGPADLARLSAVTPADVGAARADFRAKAPRPVRRLLG